MNKCFIDTNVILRFLLDDEDQALLAEHVIDGGAWTTPEVLSEITYVLHHRYGATRKDIIGALEVTANSVELRPHQESMMAIKEYSKTNLANALSRCILK